MSIQILNIQPSTRENKRLIALLSDGQKIHFGLKTGSTYIDHKDKAKRYAYIRRHSTNPKERKLIKDLTPSPATLALYILWGPSTNIKQNVKYLNHLWKKNK